MSGAVLWRERESRRAQGWSLERFHRQVPQGGSKRIPTNNLACFRTEECPISVGRKLAHPDLKQWCSESKLVQASISRLSCYLAELGRNRPWTSSSSSNWDDSALDLQRASTRICRLSSSNSPRYMHNTSPSYPGSRLGSSRLRSCSTSACFSSLPWMSLLFPVGLPLESQIETALQERWERSRARREITLLWRVHPTPHLPVSPRICGQVSLSLSFSRWWWSHLWLSDLCQSGPASSSLRFSPSSGFFKQAKRISSWVLWFHS